MNPETISPKRPIGLIILFVLLGIIVIFFAINNYIYNAKPSHEFPIYSKMAHLGPCQSSELGACSEEITIYNTGKIMVNGVRNTIGVDQVKILEEVIIKTGIRNKKCPYGQVLDYWAEYYIHPKKTIYFPGCEQELSEIDKVVDGLIHKEAKN